jgi:2-oxo-hept-3-ene-1,7-dioate hydratase
VTLAHGYDAQRAATRRKITGGAIAVGWKIGLTSVAAQQMFNAAEPIRGVLFEEMRIQSGETIPMSRFCAPRVEVELAFVLKRDLRGPICTIPNVLEATAYVVPALEIIDDRVAPLRGEPTPLATVVADNSGAAAFVLGDHHIAPRDDNLCKVTARLERNGLIEDIGESASIMGHPALAVAWLVNDLARQNVGLSAGDIILAGAFIGPRPICTGDVIEAHFGKYGNIMVRFATDS